MKLNEQTLPKTRLPETTHSASTLPLITQEQSGATFANRYRIERELGRGGIGIVYLARDTGLMNRLVVIKVLQNQVLTNDWVLQKFRQETEALTRLNHPGMVSVYDAGETPDGNPYIVMQYVEGSPLRSLLTPEGMPLERVAFVMRRIGRALSAAHDKGILHRDLKPDNVMIERGVGEDEEAKLIDFGIAKIKDSVVAASTVLPILAGTIAYMSPEQLERRHYTVASDIYSLGVMAYEMVTGRRPFNPETQFQLLEMQRGGVRVKPCDLRPALSQAAQEAILKALEFEPARRFTRARDFGDALAQALNVTFANEANTLRSDEGSPNNPNAAELSAPQPPPTQLPQTQPSLTALSAPWLPIQQDYDVNADFPGKLISKGMHNSESTLLRETPGKKSARAVAAIIIGAIILSGVIGGAVFWLSRSRDTAATQNTTVTAVPRVERTLNFWLTVQKMKDDKEDGASFQSTGQEIFTDGWRFRMNISSKDAGYFYLLNEAPLTDGAAAGDTPRYQVLFPSPKIKAGDTSLPAQETVTIPSDSWYFFTGAKEGERGTEKMWMVWSKKPLTTFEDLKNVAAEKSGVRAIRDAKQTAAIQAFLTQNSTDMPIAEKDKLKRQTVIRGQGDTVVNLIELEHQ